MLAGSWYKFDVILYRAIFTIFTISNGIAKTPRDNYPLGIISIYKKLCIAGLFVLS